MEQVVNIGLIISYIMIIVGGLSAIILPLMNSLKNPKTLVFTLGGLGALLILFLIGYGLAGDEVNANYLRYGVDSGISKVVGGALIAMYLTGIAALIGIVVTEFSKMIK